MTIESVDFGFFRIEIYNYSKAAGVLAEADRKPSHSSHITKIATPVWTVGTAATVQLKIDQAMSEPETVRRRGGTTYVRQRRSNHRVLLGCVASYPALTSSFLEATNNQKQALRDWVSDVEDFVEREFGTAFVASVIHRDESHPHLHLFVVGPAARLHPGYCAEIENGQRLLDAKERLRRYKKAMQDLLDRYYEHVGRKYGHQRRGNRRPSPRVRDRKAYLARRAREQSIGDIGEQLDRMGHERMKG